ncbi:hypothetical protein KI387_034863, partial [Taxus chinensis]
MRRKKFRSDSMDSEFSPKCNCSTESTGSPEMERRETLKSVNKGLANPRAKRRLHFEEEDEVQGMSSPKNEDFGDFNCHSSLSSTSSKQGMLSSLQHHIAKAKRRLRLGSLQNYSKISGAQNLKECSQRTEMNRLGFKGLDKNLGHQTSNKFDKDASEAVGNKVFFQKGSRISLREPEIAPVTRNFEMPREVLDNRRKIKRTNQKLKDLGNNLLRVPGVEPSNENIRGFDGKTSEQPVDETIDQSSNKYSTNSAKEHGNAPASENLQKSHATLGEELCRELKLEGSCENHKDLVNGSVQRSGNEPADENFKKSCRDRSEKPINEVIDNGAKKYKKKSAQKRRNRPFIQAFEKPSAALGQAVRNQMISQNLQRVDKKMKKSNEDRSDQHGNKDVDPIVKKCRIGSDKVRGSEHISQDLEISCEVLSKGICKDAKVGRNTQNLRDSGNNSLQKPDKHLEKFDGVISQEIGKEIIDSISNKYSRGSVKKQQNEPSSHVFKRSRPLLEEGIDSEPKVEWHNQNLKDLGKTLAQQPADHSVEVKKYNEDRSDELVNDVIDQGFLKYSTSSTKENGAEPVSQGFDKSCVFTREELGNELKAQNFASSVGPNVKFHLNSGNSISNSPVTENEGPYPDFIRPFSEECRKIRDRLLELHGIPEEYAKFRARIKEKDAVPLTAQQQLLPLDKKSGAENVKTEGNTEIVSYFDKKESEIIPAVAPFEVQESMLDALISTLLSQNTTEANSRRAFASLKQRFRTWDEVHLANPKAVEDAIRCGGLAETKASRIRNILDTLMKEQGKICLEHLRSMPVEKIKAELYRFKGIGPKTEKCSDWAFTSFTIQENVIKKHDS